MAKKDNKKGTIIYTDLREALMSFDLNSFKAWIKIFNKPVWNIFKKQNEATQMMTMCKQIVNRTDMISTEAYNKAIEWLKKHNTKGGMF